MNMSITFLSETHALQLLIDEPNVNHLLQHIIYVSLLYHIVVNRKWNQHENDIVMRVAFVDKGKDEYVVAIIECG